MKVDEMITLENGKSYGLLLDSKLNNNNYFLAVLLDEKEEPTKTFTVFKEKNNNGDITVFEEKDENILKELLEDYYSQLEDM